MCNQINIVELLNLAQQFNPPFIYVVLNFGSPVQTQYLKFNCLHACLDYFYPFLQEYHQLCLNNKYNPQIKISKTSISFKYHEFSITFSDLMDLNSIFDSFQKYINSL